ncbi:hypothetical protein [Actinoplanes xinjiangensis]|uniref:hypothetical protein n=1 Tax=Actinoplanes xinjiangensis TaxID=512350 RepID=UPI00342AF3C0
MIRRLLPGMDPELPTAVISVWFAGRATATTSTADWVIVVDGKTCAAPAHRHRSPRTTAGCEQPPTGKRRSDPLRWGAEVTWAAAERIQGRLAPPVNPNLSA